MLLRDRIAYQQAQRDKRLADMRLQWDAKVAAEIAEKAARRERMIRYAEQAEERRRAEHKAWLEQMHGKFAGHGVNFSALDIKHLNPCGRFDEVALLIGSAWSDGKTVNIMQAVEAGCTLMDLRWVVSALSRFSEEIDERRKKWRSDCFGHEDDAKYRLESLIRHMSE